MTIFLNFERLPLAHSQYRSLKEMEFHNQRRKKVFLLRSMLILQHIHWNQSRAGEYKNTLSLSIDRPKVLLDQGLSRSLDRRSLFALRSPFEDFFVLSWIVWQRCYVSFPTRLCSSQIRSDFVSETALCVLFNQTSFWRVYFVFSSVLTVQRDIKNGLSHSTRQRSTVNNSTTISKQQNTHWQAAIHYWTLSNSSCSTEKADQGQSSLPGNHPAIHIITPRKPSSHP